MEQITWDGIHDKGFMEIRKEDLGCGFDIFWHCLSSLLAQYSINSISWIPLLYIGFSLAQKMEKVKENGR